MSSAVEYHTCPICKSKSLREHCEAVGCNWYRCVIKECDTVLDTGLMIGHMNNRAPVTEGKAGKRAKGRVSLIMKDGEWRERIYG